MWCFCITYFVEARHTEYWMDYRMIISIQQSIKYAKIQIDTLLLLDLNWCLYRVTKKSNNSTKPSKYLHIYIYQKQNKMLLI